MADVADHNKIIHREADEPGAAFEGIRFTIPHGKISEIRAVSDRLGLFLQLGWDWPTSD